MGKNDQPGDRPRPAALRLADAIDAFNDRIGRGTAWICLAIVLVVANNVILRYAFRLGPVSLQELEWHLMSPIALIGMSYALLHGDHVRVDILYDRFGPLAKDVIDLFAAVATIIISVVIFKLSLGFVEQAYLIDEGSPDPGGLPHRFLLRAFIPLGFALLMLQAVGQLLRQIIKMAGNR